MESPWARPRASAQALCKAGRSRTLPGETPNAGEARDRIDAQNDAANGPGRVGLEIASATAYPALGQNDAALESLERALIADPGLELDPALTSPKVLTIFPAARGRATPTR